MNKQEKEIFGLHRITKKHLKELCKKHKLYQTPHLNDQLYLHFQGFQSIENLEEYTGLKCLWLESNAISEIQGLEAQTELKCLFLQNNLIKKIENLQCCTLLDTLNLASNHISKIENCGIDILPVLSTLNLSKNYLRNLDGVQELLNCTSLWSLDLSHNRIDDILVVKVFAGMPELRVLILQGNPVVSKVPQYRKTMILECKNLTYLDSRPVFPKDRACAEAWKRGGYEEERREHERWIKEDRRKIRDCVNAALRLRIKHGQAAQLLPSSDEEEEPKKSETTVPEETSMCEDLEITGVNSETKPKWSEFSQAKFTGDSLDKLCQEIIKENDIKNVNDYETKEEHQKKDEINVENKEESPESQTDPRQQLVEPNKEIVNFIKDLYNSNEIMERIDEATDNEDPMLEDEEEVGVPLGDQDKEDQQPSEIIKENEQLFKPKKLIEEIEDAPESQAPSSEEKEEVPVLPDDKNTEATVKKHRQSTETNDDNESSFLSVSTEFSEPNNDLTKSARSSANSEPNSIASDLEVENAPATDHIRVIFPTENPPVLPEQILSYVEQVSRSPSTGSVHSEKHIRSSSSSSSSSSCYCLRSTPENEDSSSSNLQRKNPRVVKTKNRPVKIGIGSSSDDSDSSDSDSSSSSASSSSSSDSSASISRKDFKKSYANLHEKYDALVRHKPKPIPQNYDYKSLDEQIATALAKFDAQHDVPEVPIRKEDFDRFPTFPKADNQAAPEKEDSLSLNSEKRMNSSTSKESCAESSFESPSVSEGVSNEDQDKGQKTEEEDDQEDDQTPLGRVKSYIDFESFKSELLLEKFLLDKVEEESPKETVQEAVEDDSVLAVFDSTGDTITSESFLEQNSIEIDSGILNEDEGVCENSVQLEDTKEEPNKVEEICTDINEERDEEEVEDLRSEIRTEIHDENGSREEVKNLISEIFNEIIEEKDENEDEEEVNDLRSFLMSFDITDEFEESNSTELQTRGVDSRLTGGSDSGENKKNTSAIPGNDDPAEPMTWWARTLAEAREKISKDLEEHQQQQSELETEAETENEPKAPPENLEVVDDNAAEVSSQLEAFLEEINQAQPEESEEDQTGIEKEVEILHEESESDDSPSDSPPESPRHAHAHAQVSKTIQDVIQSFSDIMDILAMKSQEKTKLLQDLIANPLTRAFSAQSADQINRQILELQRQKKEKLQNLIDNCYAQRDKYDDSLEVVNGRLMVVKKTTGALEELPPPPPPLSSSTSSSAGTSSGYPKYVSCGVSTIETSTRDDHNFGKVLSKINHNEDDNDDDDDDIEQHASDTRIKDIFFSPSSVVNMQCENDSDSSSTEKENDCQKRAVDIDSDAESLPEFDKGLEMKDPTEIDFILTNEGPTVVSECQEQLQVELVEPPIHSLSSLVDIGAPAVTLQDIALVFKEDGPKGGEKENGTSID